MLSLRAGAFPRAPAFPISQKIVMLLVPGAVNTGEGRAGSDAVNAEKVREFGAFSGSGEIEARRSPFKKLENTSAAPWVIRNV